MMTAIKCPTPDKLKSLSLGRLLDEESDELMAHINSCSSCQTEMETVDDLEDSLIASIRGSGAFADYYAEPDCQVAMANALGALARAGNSDQSGDSQTELPKQIGEYEIVRPLGRGGMGSVYLARHTKLGRQVALKILAHHRLGDQRVRDRFEVEMQAIGRLSHPNIVTAHDARDIAGTPVLVTEFIDGFDLGQLLQRTGPLSVANACEIVRQIANALEYTSGQGFVHRDVKPSNIMLGRNSDVKLLDLGLARIEFGDPDRPEMTGTGQAMGTADYIAPEQVNDSRSVDVRADIYSLGCTLYKLLTGVAPFADDSHTTAFAKMTAHVSTPAPSLATVAPSTPSKLAKLVDSMLAKAPSDRPTSPAEVARQLESFVVGYDFDELLEAADRSTAKNAAPQISPKLAVQPKAVMERTFPGSILVGTGLVALLIGFALGVIVTITFPDGSTTKVSGPDGTDVKIENDGKADSNRKTALAAPTSDEKLPNRREEIILDRLLPLQLKQEELLTRYGPDHPEVKSISRQLERFKELYPDIPLANVRPQNTDASRESRSEVVPLMFAILADDDQHALSDDLPDSPPEYGPIVTKNATWFPIDDSLEIPNVEFDGGKKFAPIENGTDATIRWTEIFGQISATTMAGSSSGNATTEFHFQKKLADKMNRLTSAHLKRKLAVIVHGRIIAAPKIMSAISDRAQITGQFDAEDMRYMHDALNGGLLSMVQPKKRGDRNTSHPTAQDAQDKRTSTSTGAYTPMTATPLMFGIAKQKLDGVTEFPQAPGSLFIYKDALWCTSVDKTLRVNSSVFDDGKLFTPLETDPTALIHWHDVVGHMSAKMRKNPGAGNGTLELEFDDSLSDKMKRLTKKYHGRELAIVMNGRIVALPTIRATISEKAELSGQFSNEEILTLLHALNAGMLPLDNSETEAAGQHRNFSLRDLFRSKPLDQGVVNLKKIGLAVVNYESAHRRFPSSTASKAREIKHAQPHSWRVAILPFIERLDLYERYRFDEPWDSDHNRQFLNEMPDVFRSPHAPNEQSPGHTNYVAFVGRESVFAKSVGITLADIHDGTSKTLMVVETKLSMPWTKPEDIDFWKPNDSVKAAPFDGQPLRFVMADGSIRTLANDHQSELFKLITRSGRETFDLNEIAPPVPAR